MLLRRAGALLLDSMAGSAGLLESSTAATAARSSALVQQISAAAASQCQQQRSTAAAAAAAAPAAKPQVTSASVAGAFAKLFVLTALLGVKIPGPSWCDKNTPSPIPDGPAGGSEQGSSSSGGSSAAAVDPQQPRHKTHGADCRQSGHDPGVGRLGSAGAAHNPVGGRLPGALGRVLHGGSSAAARRERTARRMFPACLRQWRAHPWQGYALSFPACLR